MPMLSGSRSCDALSACGRTCGGAPCGMVLIAVRLGGQPSLSTPTAEPCASHLTSVPRAIKSSASASEPLELLLRGDSVELKKIARNAAESVAPMISLLSLAEIPLVHWEEEQLVATHRCAHAALVPAPPSLQQRAHLVCHALSAEEGVRSLLSCWECSSCKACTPRCSRARARAPTRPPTHGRAPVALLASSPRAVQEGRNPLPSPPPAGATCQTRRTCLWLMSRLLLSPSLTRPAPFTRTPRPPSI